MTPNPTATCSAVAISDMERLEIVGDLVRIATAHGAQEVNGSAPKWLVNLRANVRNGLNACIPSLEKLLEANGRAEEFAGKLRASLAPRRADIVPIRQALVLDNDACCTELREVGRVLGGDESGPELHALRDRICDLERALALAKDAIDAELAERTRAVAVTAERHAQQRRAA